MTAAVAEVQAAARQWVAETLASGADVSGAEVGSRFGRSDRWGRDVIAAVRAELEAAEAPELPPVPPEFPPEATPEPQPVAEQGSEPLPAETPVSASVPCAHPGARLVAWAGFLFGTVISVAANVLAAWIPPEGAAAGWQPGLAPQVGAAVWPLALLLSVEVLSRVAWPAGWAWTLARFGGVLAVAAGAAVISYGHIHDVLVHWRYDPAGAYVGPLVVDGLMVVSGFALLALSGRRTPGGAR